MGFVVSIERDILKWLASDKAGVSSKAMAFCSVDIEDFVTFSAPPSDPSDFERCLGLVRKTHQKVIFFFEEYSL
jgi:hypothetical protein